jgi:predicted O-methyltransferase YrrM
MLSRNAVLDRLLSTKQIALADGQTLSLHHPEFPEALSHIDLATGQLLQRLVRQVRPQRSLEVGLAYGVSTLFICEALSTLESAPRHIVIDPFQHGKWRGLGLQHVSEAGFAHLVDFRESPSEIVLPQLLAAGTSVDFAFIDGLHRFDQVMTEFYYVNRLLRPGGVVIFDDADRRSVSRVIRHALTYPCYELCATSAGPPPPVAWRGRLRRRIGSLTLAQRIVRRDVLVRDWDLGLGARCVALEKTAADERHTYFDAEF